MQRKLFATTLIISLGLLSLNHALADTPQCGLASKWTGKVCVGPKGKSYCPLDMTMEGDTCSPTASPGVQATISPVRASPDADRALIIQMLTSLTNQATQQAAAIKDLQQKLIAMQVVLNLTSTNADKAKAAASNTEAALAGMQASGAGSAANNTSLQSNLTALTSKIAAIQSEAAALQSAQVAQQASLADMSKRLLFTCLVVTGINNGIDSKQLYKNACTSTWWPPGTWNFNTPFGN